MRSVVVLVCLAGSAAAAPKLEPSTAAKPPRFVDESSVYMQVGNAGDGYWAEVYAEVFGMADKDRARIEVRRGAKVVATAECSGDTASVRRIGLYKVHCRTSTDKVLKGAGPIEIDLIVEDDAVDKSYIARTFKGNVKQWEKGNFQIEPDDLLASAYLVQPPSDDGDAEAMLRFWITGTRSFEATLKCTVDGKPLKILDGSVGDEADIVADVIKGKTRQTWHWSRVTFSSVWFRVAPGNSKATPDRVYLSTTPGKWVCQLRRNGVTIRELSWTVANGKVEPHPMQQAKDAPPAVAEITQIDVKIPKDNGNDQRIKPAVLKKSRNFGLPWPTHDSVKALHAALPPAFENANPPAAKRAVGKTLPGSQASPPKFVDESRTVVRVVRDMDGYRFYVAQVVGGVSWAKSNFFRLDWKSGGKVVGSTKCTGEEKMQEDIVVCDYRDKPLTAKGPIEALLVEYDDSDGNEYILRTYKFNVVHPKSYGDPLWQVIPDDVLATAWVKHFETRVSFRFWLAMENTDAELRCTVNGTTKLPDIRLSQQTDAPTIEAEYRANQNAETKKYIWSWVGADADINPGPLPKAAKKEADRVEYLAHYPGKWDCGVRQKGKTMRQLLFTVNDKGYVEADPAQAGGPPNFQQTVPIELRFGKDILDVRVRPDAMKKGRGFGLPWPKPPTKPFPPASGLPDLK